MSRREAPAALRWTVYVAIAIVFAIACGFLSNWQFTRNEERARQLALVEANYDAEPVPLADVVAAGADLDPSDEWTPVALEGEYLTDEQLLVRNRPHGGTAAFEVLVPFRLDDGRTLLVDRGWVAPGEGDLPDEIPAPPAGATEVVVRLRPEEAAPRSGRSAPDGQVPTINLGLVADAVASGDSLEPGFYGLMVTEDPAPATLPGAIDPPTDDPGPHLSYAVQWILFAVMGFAFITYILVTERRYAREDAEERQARRARRRDRDSEEEDALLDAR
ncbi:SURF1 family cytochrome oxidase biogenesis protein [Microbacterium sp. RD1]|uniref:SURF1 family cytochrome oxidase biogenesis protein n=1 Tax=Microbacterium sp. RD1 TaxID=3457313 RepID=UPI003FA57F51